MLYGSYAFPAKAESEGVSISVERGENRFVYTRECLGEKFEKVLAAEGGELIVNPVEPLNKPVEVTSYLQIGLKKTFLLEPRSTKEIYLRFPVEIGVFISSKRSVEPIDVITLVNQKYTLYGEPSNGVICRYWKSEPYPGIPETRPLEEGVIELTVNNNIEEWVELTKVIFNAVGMKIYYNNMVSMKAVMNISGKTIAETDFKDSPLQQDMKKAVELYSVRRVAIASRKMLMGWGL